MAKLALVCAITGTVIVCGLGSIFICKAKAAGLWTEPIQCSDDSPTVQEYAICAGDSLKPLPNKPKPPSVDTDHTDHDGIWFNDKPEPPANYDPYTIPPAKPMHEGFWLLDNGRKWP